MVLKVQIVDSHGTGNAASVNSDGSLHVGPVHSGTPYTSYADVINTGYTYDTLDGTCISPMPGKVFKITSILIFADRSVGSTSGAVVNIYESDAPSSTTSTRHIIDSLELVKNTNIFMNVDIEVTAGKWVNIKTDDNNIGSTIIGYYADA